MTEMTEMTEITFAWAMTITVMLSFLFAAAELFSKFKDEPFFNPQIPDGLALYCV
jgi:hypothetical protein